MPDEEHNQHHQPTLLLNSRHKLKRPRRFFNEDLWKRIGQERFEVSIRRWKWKGGQPHPEEASNQHLEASPCGEFSRCEKDVDDRRNTFQPC